MTVTCVDDAPSRSTTRRPSPRTRARRRVDVLANDTDIDGGPEDDHLGDASRPTAPWSITGDGTASPTQPDANYCNAGAATDTFTYTLNGGSRRRSR